MQLWYHGLQEFDRLSPSIRGLCESQNKSVGNGNVCGVLFDKSLVALSHRTKQNMTDESVSDVPVPRDSKEQTGIAETLKAADDHIRALEEQIRKAERVKKALVQNGFPYESDSTGLPMINSLIVAPITNGYSPVCPDYETGRWVLGLDALTAHGFDPEGRKSAPNNDPKLLGNELQVNDILISRSNTRERVYPTQRRPSREAVAVAKPVTGKIRSKP